MARLLAAFIRRDFLNWSSYRFGALSQTAGMLVTLFFVFMIGKTLGATDSGFLSKYNTDYAGFLMSSVTFAEAWSVGFLMSRGLRESQSMGTLEAMLLSRFGIFRVMLGTGAFLTVRALVQLVLFLAVAVTIFGLWHHANVLSALVIFLAGLLAMGCLGLLSVSFVLVLKQGDPITAAYALLNTLFTGAIIPREVLPHWLQAFSLFLPLTYALDGMRQALSGGTLAQIAPQVLILLATFVGLLPFTIWTLNWAARRAKTEGSLVQY